MIIDTDDDDSDSSSSFFSQTFNELFPTFLPLSFIWKMQMVPHTCTDDAMTTYICVPNCSIYDDKQTSNNSTDEE